MQHLAIITTHPIQYNAPWFRLLAERGHIAIKVFYTWSQVQNEEKFDPGFGKAIAWDIPLLEGYDYTFVKNTSKNPGSKTFNGIQNPTLIREIEDWGADALLIFGWKFKSHLQAIRYFHNKIPVLFRGDSTLLDDESVIKSVFRTYTLRSVFSKIDYALYVGSANKAYYERAGLRANKLVFVPHAIDNKRFASAGDSDIPEWPNVLRDKTIFLYAGKLELKKGVGFLLSTFSALNTKDADLIIVGNGPIEKELKSLYGKINNIHFLDFQNQKTIPSILKNADIFILPSKGPGETWGLAVNEAMACGRPVLVSDKCGCAADLVEEGKTGFVFRSGDANDLKDKIGWCIQHRNVLKQMGANASQKIQDWSFEKIVTAIENLVNSPDK